MSNGQVTILYFASARDATKTSQETLSIDSLRTAGGAQVSIPDLITALKARHPALQLIFTTAIVAVNNAYVDRDGRSVDSGDIVAVKAGDEIAVIPPVSGG
ncbi:uncharacterized protein EV422DRAFT_566812 [Fimicolochytrium jonesii]|uniref:uncharacterized protein n=1 Tax=Fimicolochytrium jonesii TaxID=1396493 RepID=UPI0022FEC3EC|nr:uncharacterized protein EV422DRAFT_566812 [Fimicolochytrium jonesii]KAI8821737.1 hypothetical protein EV422DRAFT_566812 [Fimicolochytrium jonesii]